MSDLSNGPNNGRLYIAWNDVADEFLRENLNFVPYYGDWVSAGDIEGLASLGAG